LLRSYEFQVGIQTVIVEIHDGGYVDILNLRTAGGGEVSILDRIDPALDDSSNPQAVLIAVSLLIPPYFFEIERILPNYGDFKKWENEQLGQSLSDIYQSKLPDKIKRKLLLAKAGFPQDPH